MADLSTVQGHCAAAAEHIASGDFDAAEVSLMCAQAIMAGIPDSKHGNDEIKMSARIDTLMLQIRKKRGSSIGIQPQRVTYVAL